MGPSELARGRGFSATPGSSPSAGIERRIGLQVKGGGLPTLPMSLPSMGLHGE